MKTMLSILASLLLGTGNTSGNFMGTFNLSAVNLQRLLAGLLYINIHTTMNGGGEIRGQIVPSP